VIEAILYPARPFPRRAPSPSCSPACSIVLDRKPITAGDGLPVLLPHRVEEAPRQIAHDSALHFRQLRDQRPDRTRPLPQGCVRRPATGLLRPRSPLPKGGRWPGSVSLRRYASMAAATSGGGQPAGRGGSAASSRSTKAGRPRPLVAPLAGLCKEGLEALPDDSVEERLLRLPPTIAQGCAGGPAMALPTRGCWLWPRSEGRLAGRRHPTWPRKPRASQ